MKPAEKRLGLYIHIPFCKQKCVYCDFYSLPHTESRMDAYLSLIHIWCLHQSEELENHPVDHRGQCSEDNDRSCNQEHLGGHAGDEALAFEVNGR